MQRPLAISPTMRLLLTVAALLLWSTVLLAPVVRSGKNVTSHGLLVPSRFTLPTKTASLIPSSGSSSSHHVPAVLDDDVIEALVMRTAILRLLEASEKVLRASSFLVRTCGETASNFVSSLMKGVGGAMNLVATFLSTMSEKVDAAIPKNSDTGKALNDGDTRVNLVTTLRNTARLLAGVAHACIWGGDITESVTHGLGEAVHDSFLSLQMLTRAGHRLITHLFSDEYFISTHSHVSQDYHAVVVVPADQEPRTQSATTSGTGSVHGRHSPVASVQTHPQVGSLREAVLPSSEEEESISVQEEYNDDVHSANNDEPPPAESQSTHSTGGWSWKAAVTNTWNSICRAAHTFIAHTRDPESFLDATMHSITITAPLFVIFAVLFVVSLLEFPRVWDKIYVLFTLLLVSYLVLWAVDRNLTRRLVTRTRALTIQQHLQQQVASFSYHPPDVVEDGDLVQGGSYHLYTPQLLHHRLQRTWEHLAAHEGEQQSQQHNHGAMQAVEAQLAHVAWINVMMSALWTTAQDETSSHSESEKSKASLASIWASLLDDIVYPPDAASSSSSEEKSAEAVGGLGVYLNEVYAEMLSAQLAQLPPGIANLRLKRFDLGTQPPLITQLRAFVYRNDTCHRLATPTRSSSSHSSAQQHSVSFETTVERLLRTLMPSHPQKPSKSASASSPLSASSFSTECDRLFVDVDFVFVSADLDVALSLRSQETQRSVWPEWLLTVSRMTLQGSARLEMQLTTDYPFFGNASMSFLGEPALDFSLRGASTASSSLEVSLASLPLAHGFVNASAHWLLRQYVSPLSMAIDMRHTICPRCDAPLPPSPYTALTHSVQGLKQRLMQHWQRLAQTVGVWKQSAVAWTQNLGRWVKTKLAGRVEATNTLDGPVSLEEA